MAYTASNVSAGKPGASGVIYRAPAGTTLPTSATATLGTDFKCLGYLSEDGITKSVERESEEIKDMGGTTVLTPQTSFGDKFTFTPIESLNPEVLKMFYGDDAVAGSALSTGYTVSVSAKEPAENVYVMDMLMTNGIRHRICIPKGKITETGEVVYKRDEAIGYEVTVTALPDTSGKTHYEYYQTESTESE